MKFIDLFAGLGGFHHAAAQLGGECVFASEINDDLRSVYEKNHGILPAGDIRNVNPKNIPNHDLLCAGFPCQPFSKAGEQVGLEDKIRGTVFFNIIEILEAKQPEFIMLENVAHFVKHDDGKTYEVVCEALRGLGYDLNCKTISPHQHGTPQIRERMYLVGKKGSLNGFQWPEQTTQKDELSISSILDCNPKNAKPLTKKARVCIELWQDFLNILPSELKLPSFPIWAMEFGCSYPYDQPIAKVATKKLRMCKGVFGCSLEGLSRSEIMRLLPTYADTKGEPFPKWKKNYIRQNRVFFKQNKNLLGRWLLEIQKLPPSFQKFEWNCQGEVRDLSEHILQFRASGLRVKRSSTSPSLVAMTTTQIPIIFKEKRHMTVKECARLQAMDSFQYFPESLEKSMKALGNAVNTHVAKLILQNLLKSKDTNT